MKKFLRRISMAIMALFLTSCFSSISGGTYRNADKYLIGSQDYAETVKSIEVHWISGEVTLVEDPNITGVKVKEENDLIDEQKVHSYLEEGNLDIRYFASGHTAKNISSKKKALTLTYNPSIEKLTVHSTAGSVYADSISVKEANFDITTGSLNVKKWTAPKADIKIVTGNVKIDEMSVDSLEADMTTGSFTAALKSIAAGNINFTTGHVYLTLPEEGGKVRIHKVTGSIDISREYTRSGEDYIFGDGAAIINISFTTGSVEIK